MSAEREVGVDPAGAGADLVEAAVGPAEAGADPVEAAVGPAQEGDKASSLRKLWRSIAWPR